jgi:hypothetical protein
MARRSFWMLFGGIWLFVGVLLFIFGIAFVLREQEFASSGTVATGIVLEKRIVPADSDSSTEYRVSYRFEADGRTIEGSDQVSVETWEGLTERGPIDIRYLRDRPESNRLNLGSDLIVAAIFLLLGIVFGGIGGFLFFRALRGVMKARRLLTGGEPVDATVTSVEPTNVSVNRRPQYRVRYSYRDRQGATHEGDSGYLSFEDANAWSVGDTVRVMYDPVKPDESYWVGAAEPAADKPKDGVGPIPDARPPVDAAPPLDAPPPG